MWLLCLDRGKPRFNRVKAGAGCASVAAEEERGRPRQDEDKGLRDGDKDGDEDSGPKSGTSTIPHSLQG